MTERGPHLLDGVTNCKRSGRNVMPLQKFLGEALARLQLSRCPSRTERRPSAPGKLIDHTQSQREFRTDHGQIGLQARRQARDRLQTLQIRRQTLRIVRDAAISGRAVKLRNARGLPQLPYQRVLAPAVSEDQNFHKPEKIKVRGSRGMLSNGELGVFSTDRFRSLTAFSFNILFTAPVYAVWIARAKCWRLTAGRL